MTTYNRAFSMPNSQTFSMKPIKEFVEHWIGVAYSAQDRNNPVVVDPFARDSKYGTITCLLYTSPSPRDGLLSRMPSSA